MKKLTFLLTSFMLLSCWKNNKEEEQFYAEDNAPIDTTLVDSVVGQTSFSAVNSAIEDAKKAPVLKQDTTKSPEQKLAEERKKIEQKKKSELEKKNWLNKTLLKMQKKKKLNKKRK
jgi:hypothetical protein